MPAHSHGDDPANSRHDAASTLAARPRVLPDLDTPAAIAAMVEAFYARLLEDPRLAPVFIDVAAIDLQHHLPLIKSYWEKLLLGDRKYQRHTMDIHRAIDARRRLEHEDFERWLTLFRATVDHMFAGPGARRALQLARRIAANMQVALSAVNNNSDAATCADHSQSNTARRIGEVRQ